MKKILKVRSIVAITIMATIATTAFAGCNQSAGNQKNSSAPSSSVSEVQQDEESKAESKVESSKDEKSKGESSKKESSKAESSKEKSSKVEKSEVETSVEPSKVESSIEESSEKTSTVESSVTEISKEESFMSSEDVFSSIPFYEGAGIRLNEDDIVCYGHALKDIPYSEDSLFSIPKGSLIAILGKYENGEKVIIATGWNASIVAKSENIEFLPLNYKEINVNEALYFPD